MKKVAFDIDGCVVDLAPALSYYLMKICGVEWDREKNKMYTIEESTGLSHDIVLECVNAAISDLERQKSYPYCISFIKRYYEENGRQEVIFVTNRWDKENTYKLISKLLKKIPYRIEFVEGDKTNFLVSEGIDILIEDRLDWANSAAEKGVEVYLLSKNYNDEGEVKGVKRVENWKELFNLFFCTKRRKKNVVS